MIDTVTLIEATPKTLRARLHAVWKYRSFYPFLLKEISSRKFRSTMLGMWWLVLRPLIPTVMAVVTFTYVVAMESHGLPYVIFYFSGFMVWHLFQATLAFMPRSLSYAQGLMRRTYFPKLLVPFASIGPPLIEFLVTLAMFLLVLIYFKLTRGTTYLVVGWQTLWFIPSAVMALMFGMMFGIVSSVLALFVRDIVFTMSYFGQMFFFLTPVLYPVAFIPEQYRWILYVVNPMAKIVEVSRWSLTGVGEFNPLFVATSFGTVLLLFIGALGFFLRSERFFTDEL